jgi:hypothetical protein
MYPDRWIDVYPARVAHHTPHRLAERLKLANQSATYVTRSSGDERADQGGLCAGGLARMPNTRPWSQAQNQLALADRAYLVALARVEVDQAWRGQRPLACPSTYEQLPTRDEYEGVLVNLMLLQALALGQQQRNDAVGIVIGTKDLRLVSRDTQPI